MRHTEEPSDKFLNRANIYVFVAAMMFVAVIPPAILPIVTPLDCPTTAYKHLRRSPIVQCYQSIIRFVGAEERYVEWCSLFQNDWLAFYLFPESILFDSKEGGQPILCGMHFANELDRPEGEGQNE